MERPLVRREAVAFKPDEDGRMTIMVRRKKRRITKITYGPANEKELSYIRDNYPDLAEIAGL